MYVAKLGDNYISSFDLNTIDGSIFSIFLTKDLNRAQFFSHDNLRRSTHDEMSKMGVKFCMIEVKKLMRNKNREGGMAMYVARLGGLYYKKSDFLAFGSRVTSIKFDEDITKAERFKAINTNSVVFEQLIKMGAKFYEIEEKEVDTTNIKGQSIEGTRKIKLN